MKINNCVICKEKIDIPHKIAIVNKDKYPICSKDCHKEYMRRYISDENFPNNYKTYEIKNKYSPQEREEFPDY